MHPIVWLPLTNIEDPTNAEPLEVMRNNKGTAILHKSDIQMHSIGINDDTIFGKTPLFTNANQSRLNFTLGTQYSSTIWKGMSISFFVRITNVTGNQTILSLNAGNAVGIEVYDDNSLKLSFSGNAGNYITELQQDQLLSVIITYDGSKFCVYINGTLKLEKSGAMRNMSNNPVMFDTHASDCDFELFNLKIYDHALSMRHVLEDYACLCTHYKFDGTSADDPNYSPEYDASGFGNDLVLPNNGTVTSTFSPSRQLSTLLNGACDVKLPYFSCIMFWLYYNNNDVHLGWGSLDITIKSDGIKTIIVSLNNGTISRPQQTTPVQLSGSTWYLVHITRNSESVSIYINNELIALRDISNIYSSSGTTLNISADVIMSDFRAYINKPSESEINYLLNREVTIDEKGTVYGTELQVVDHMVTFAFGDRGQIIAPSFESPEYSNNKGIMDYDYINNVMKIRDFEET